MALESRSVRSHDKKPPNLYGVHLRPNSHSFAHERYTGYLRLGLLTAFILAIYIRFLGLNWGLNAGLYLHPDESNFVVANVLKMINGEKITFLNYPQLMISLTVYATRIAEIFGFVQDKPTVHLAARAVSATLSTLTLVPIYLLCRDLSDNRWAGLLGASLFAVLPVSVWLGHFGTVDTGLTFAILWSLYAICVFFEKRNTKWLLIAGGLCGLAAGFKYNGGIVIIILVTAIVLDGQSSTKEKAQQVVVAGLASFVVFAISSPLSVAQPIELLKSLRYELNNADTGYVGLNTLPNSIRFTYGVYPLVTMAIFGFGPFLYLLMILLVPFSDLRRCWPLLMFLVVWGMLNLFNTFQPIRYYLVFYAVLLMLTAIAAPKVWTRASTSVSAHNKVRVIQKGLFGVLSIMIGLTAYYSYSSSLRFKADTRVDALGWLASNAESKDNVMFAGAGILADGFSRRNITSLQQYLAYDFPAVRAVNDADLLVISSMEYARYYKEGSQQLGRLYSQLLQGNMDGWAIQESFHSSFFLKDFVAKLDPLFGNYFISPDITIFSRPYKNHFRLPLHIAATDPVQLNAISANDFEWYSPETWGAWARNGSAKLFIPLQEDQLDQKIRLALSLWGYSDQPESKIIISVNGRENAECIAPDVRRASKPAVCSYVIAPELFRNVGYLRINLEAARPFTRRELKGVADDRRLGVGLSNLELVQVGN